MDGVQEAYMVMATVNGLMSITAQLIKSVRLLKEGRPEEIDVEKLEQMLLQLPDLPTLDETEEK